MLRPPRGQGGNKVLRRYISFFLKCFSFILHTTDSARTSRQGRSFDFYLGFFSVRIIFFFWLKGVDLWVRWRARCGEPVLQTNRTGPGQLKLLNNTNLERESHPAVSDAVEDARHRPTGFTDTIRHSTPFYTHRGNFVNVCTRQIHAFRLRNQECVLMKLSTKTLFSQRQRSCCCSHSHPNAATPTPTPT